MTEQQIAMLIELLQDIRENQRLQVERQLEGLSLQKEQFEIVKIQFERAEKISAKAELIQEKGAQLIAASRKSLKVILPIVFILIAYVSWLILYKM